MTCNLGHILFLFIYIFGGWGSSSSRKSNNFELWDLWWIGWLPNFKDGVSLRLGRKYNFSDSNICLNSIPSWFSFLVSTNPHVQIMQAT